MSISKDIFNIATNKKQVKESITPHKICVAILIRQFCLFRESGEEFQLIIKYKYIN